MSTLSACSILVNGQLESSIGILDRGLMYGDGVFETVRVVGGDAPLWRYHCRRLLTGCKKLGITVSSEMTDKLWADVQRVVSESDLANKRCVVKLVVTRGEGGRGYKPPEHQKPSVIVVCYPYPEYPADYSKMGISMSTCQHRLSHNAALAGIKHLNRLDQVLASNELNDSVADGVMLDQGGAVIESTKANILFFDHDGIVSPNTDLCGVDGVAREFIFENLSSMALQGRFDTVMPDTIGQFQGMAVVNSVAGVWPVRWLDGVELPVSPVTRKIQHFFNNELKFELG